MKRQDVQATIPVALQELHEAGFERVYVDQLGEQVTRHETEYLERRSKIRNVLSVVGIKIDEIPHGHARPGAYKMYRSLTKLEDAGVIAGEFEPERDDGKLSRRMYFLVNQPD